ncbi:hypothetical protein IMZ48_31840 [Candidatus Bathyarchaeota archaeon]|nr:hypothetical protein [Candidatus Bathyarchaeota archaeon]
MRPHVLLFAASLAAAQTKLLIGAPNQILVADFNGTSFSVVANATDEGTNPSWLAFREPNLVYAVDELSALMSLFVVSLSSFLLVSGKGFRKRGFQEGDKRG